MSLTKRPSAEKNKLPHTRITFTLTFDMENQLKKLANDSKMNLSKFIRKSLEKSLRPQKEQADIEFIRKQIQEEIDIMLKQYKEELEEIIQRIGVYVISQCMFSADIVQMLVEEKNGIVFEEIMEQAQKEALIILSDYGDKENLEAYSKSRINRYRNHGGFKSDL